MTSEPAQKINFVAMTHICAACDKDCETAWKDGTCKILEDNN